jgi:uncharacterized protein (DUF2141 family)
MKNFIFMSLFTSSLWAGSLEVTVTDIVGKAGEVALAIFKGSTGFPDEPRHTYKTVRMKNPNRLNSIVIKVELPEGDYGISAFYDLNNNQILDTNFLGIPTEKFGFSQNPNIMFGPPHYEECRFDVPAQGTVKKNLKLIKLF